MAAAVAGVAVAAAGVATALAGSPAHAPTPNPTVSCRQRAQALAAARASVIDDWAAHVAPGQKPEVLAATRARGPARADAFDKAAAAARGCVGVPAACADATTAALDAAAAAVGEWRAHLTAMAERRAGGIDAVRAQHLWEQASASAPANINRFRAADEAAGKVCG